MIYSLFLNRHERGLEKFIEKSQNLKVNFFQIYEPVGVKIPALIHQLKTLPNPPCNSLNANNISQDMENGMGFELEGLYNFIFS